MPKNNQLIRTANKFQKEKKGETSSSAFLSVNQRPLRVMTINISD